MLYIVHFGPYRPHGFVPGDASSLLSLTPQNAYSMLAFGASGLEVSPRHQEQNREGGKAQSEQYTACWAGLLHLVSEPTSPAIRWCRRGRRAP